MTTVNMKSGGVLLGVSFRRCRRALGSGSCIERGLIEREILPMRLIANAQPPEVRDATYPPLAERLGGYPELPSGPFDEIPVVHTLANRTICPVSQELYLRSDNRTKRTLTAVTPTTTIARVIAPTVRKYREELCARVREARDSIGWTQLQMADALQIELDTYRKYEKRTPLPHHLIERFALFVGRDVAYIVTGHNATRQRAAAKSA